MMWLWVDGGALLHRVDQQGHALCGEWSMSWHLQLRPASPKKKCERCVLFDSREQ